MDPRPYVLVGQEFESFDQILDPPLFCLQFARDFHAKIIVYCLFTQLSDFHN